MRKTTIIIFTFIFSTIAITARQPERGYRGFVDANMSIVPNIGFLFGDPGDSEVFLGGTTSHGYQFNSWLYVGGGAGFEYNLGWKPYPYYSSSNIRFVIPIFAEARADARWGRFTPFASIRLGANIAHGAGIYFSPTIGYRFNWGRRCAINLALGINLWGRKHKYPNYVMQPGGGLDTDGTYTTYHGTEVKPTIRLGLEF